MGLLIRETILPGLRCGGREAEGGRLLSGRPAELQIQMVASPRNQNSRAVLPTARPFVFWWHSTFAYLT